MKLLIRLDPLSVQIDTRQVTPRIPIDNSIRVQHGYDLEYEVITEDPRAQTRPHQIVYYTFYHVGCPCFTRMHS